MAILMLTSWSEVSTPAELSSASVLSLTPSSAASTRPRWVKPRLAPSPITLARKLGAVDAQRIVGAVAGLEMAFGRRLHVGADAAEIEQVDRRLEDGAHQVDRRRAAGASMPSACCRLGRQRDRLGGAVEHAAARRDLRLVVVHPRRARQVEQALALLPARRRIGSGVEEDVAVVEGGDEPDRLARAACRCRTRRPTCRRRRPR